MATAIYAGSSSGSLTKLPSPISLKTTSELIWSENTGRAQSGENQAKMIGDTIAKKRTYAIEWGVISQAQLSTILENLTSGFFYFGIGTESSPPSSPTKFYRSELTYETIEAETTYYKNVTVSVIEQ